MALKMILQLKKVRLSLNQSHLKKKKDCGTMLVGVDSSIFSPKPLAFEHFVFFIKKLNIYSNLKI